MTIDTSPEAVAQMLSGVTPGRWQIDAEWNVGDSDKSIMHGSVSIQSDAESSANARFIAYAREAVPALVARMAELELLLNPVNLEPATVAERDMWRTKAQAAEAKIIQMTAAWGEDAVRVEELTAEVARLRAALKPFAEHADEYPINSAWNYPAVQARSLLIGVFWKARAALQETKP